MNFQGHVADITLSATETFLRYAKALPADKLDWKPAPESRSALSMLQEVAQDPRDLAKLFNGHEVAGAGSDEYLIDCSENARNGRHCWSANGFWNSTSAC